MIKHLVAYCVHGEQNKKNNKNIQLQCQKESNFNVVKYTMDNIDFFIFDCLAIGNFFVEGVNTGRPAESKTPQSFQ